MQYIILLKNFIILLAMIISVSTMAEDRIKIAVVDTGISYSQANAAYSCKGEHKSFIDNSIYDNHGHGTNGDGYASWQSYVAGKHR